MTQHAVVLPRQKVPALNFSLVGGGTWSMDAQTPEHFTMIVFYRGHHCPICKTQLNDLLSKKEDFAAAGVNVVAVSSNPQDLAEKSVEEWGLEGLDVGHSVDLADALEWGLHLSVGREGTAEPELFSEPGIYLVRADGTLYFSSIQTMPFARPQFSDILGAAKFVIDNGYPARGEVVSL